MAPATARSYNSGNATAATPRSGNTSPTARCANPNSGRCLDVPNSATADGTRLQIYDCNGTGAQTWTLPS
ncbi:RICIN domain-containing protein [Fodinicola feengrottensis]|uniref:RICIN domain-containing protein n=1 Tax=Fodinicola feengrottensis TaxID=435914 RepID=UPI0013D8C490|nr:RICIN domain-containing protein [Fodinicola feengrottensis]